jgi:FAR1 DNA-binding domain
LNPFQCSTEVVVLAIDMVFETLEEGECFYYAYANTVGFDVRKAQHEKEGEGISWKLYVCNKEGKRRSPISDVKYKRKVMRVGCPASIKFRRMDNGSYMVSQFEELHSHGLVSSSKRKFLKGSRRVNDRIKRTLATCSKVNISVAQTFHLVKEQVGGYENIGCTQKDLSYFQQELRTLVQDSDAQILLDKLNSMKMRDPSFFFEIDYDDDKRL